MRPIWFAGALVSFAMLHPAVASAQIGGIVRAGHLDGGTVTAATASTDWTTAHLAGQVVWSRCGSGACSWVPVATVQPALPSYSCRGDEVFDRDPNTMQVWAEAGQQSNQAVSFDLPAALILSGVRGQRLCLSVIETVSELDPTCVAEAPIFGYDPATCPTIKILDAWSLADVPLSEPQPAPAPAPAPAPTATPVPVPSPVSHAPAPVSVHAAKLAASRFLARHLGRRWRLRSRSHLSCHATSDAARKICIATWRYRSHRYRESVVVRRTAGRVTAALRR